MTDGIINIYKPPGMTSHDVVYRVRRALGIKKVGHTGTLDPAAEGVLPVCVGKGTKAADLLTAADKRYRAQLILGLETDTEDTSGAVLRQSEVAATEAEIRAVIQGFVGEIEQIPPMYSAIKQNGQKLYELARQGIEVERQPRKVTIFDIQVLSVQENTVFLDVSCSKGTYIRTLCADIGKKLGCGGAMGQLIRTQSGMFSEKTAVALGDFEENPTGYITPLDAVFSYPVLQLDPVQTKRVTNGVPIYFHGGEAGCTYKVYGDDGRFLSISQLVHMDGRLCLKPLKMFV